MSRAKILRKDKGEPPHIQWVIELDGKHYLISHSERLSTPETMAFRCDKLGRVRDWADVAGGQGMTHEQVIAELEQGGEQEYKFGHSRGILGLFDDLMEAAEYRSAKE